MNECCKKARQDLLASYWKWETTVEDKRALEEWAEDEELDSSIMI